MPKTKTIKINPAKLNATTARTLYHFLAQQPEDKNVWESEPIEPYSFEEKGKTIPVQFELLLQRRFKTVLAFEGEKKVPRYDVIGKKRIGCGGVAREEGRAGVWPVVCTLSPLSNQGFLAKKNKKRIVKTVDYGLFDPAKEPVDVYFANSIREADILRKFPEMHAKPISHEDGKTGLNSITDLTMRHIIGEGLFDILYDKWVDLSVEQRFRISINLLYALEKIHAAGIVHRDIKPENIIVDLHTCDVWIIDFGFSISKDEKIDQYGGTFGYAAPENDNGHPQSAKSDICALGYCLKEIWGWDREAMRFKDYPHDNKTMLFAGLSGLEQQKIQLAEVLDNLVAEDPLDRLSLAEANSQIEALYLDYKLQNSNFNEVTKAEIKKANASGIAVRRILASEITIDQLQEEINKAVDALGRIGIEAWEEWVKTASVKLFGQMTATTILPNIRKIMDELKLNQNALRFMQDRMSTYMKTLPAQGDLIKEADELYIAITSTLQKCQKRFDRPNIDDIADFNGRYRDVINNLVERFNNQFSAQARNIVGVRKR